MNRIAKIRESLQKDGYEGYVVSKGSDIKYLTGFTGEYGVALLLITAKEQLFITDSRFENQAQEETEDYTVIIYRRGSGYYQTLGEQIQKLGLKVCGVEKQDMTVTDYENLSGCCKDTLLKQTPHYLTQMRMVKTEEEISWIRKACRTSERAFYGLLGSIQPGITERDIDNELERQFRLIGGNGHCFTTIVASGEINGANCHATPSDRKIQYGDFVTIDFGTSDHDYCSDLTRTIAIGEPKNPELVRIYDTVLRAKRAAEQMLGPGVVMSDIYRTVDQVIDDAGYILPHGPGHGFGLDIHEDPFITPAGTEVMVPGIVHTIEPGIYIPGIGGARIEDDYLVTEDGSERLTNIADELMIID